MRPMLATPGAHVPPGEEWVHEVKWDGIRLVGESEQGRTQTRLATRNGNDATPAWPEIATGPTRDIVVDGEVIALNDAGLPDFRVLMDRMHNRDVRRAALYGVRVRRMGARDAPVGTTITVNSLIPSRIGIITSRRS